MFNTDKPSAYQDQGQISTSRGRVTSEMQVVLKRTFFIKSPNPASVMEEALE